MKKNIFSVIITALTVINVVLTAVMFFVMLPTFQKTNNLITQVASVLNLELDADADADADENYSIKDTEPYAVTFDSQATYNLKTDADGTQHYALLNGYSLNLNTKSDDYDEMKEVIELNTAQITSAISSVIQSHTYSEATSDLIRKEAVEEIRELLDSKVVVSIDLDGYVTQ
ncbi:MAG: hypothetical protein LUH14_05130 [Clostridiaceae bacterium]|nr:hypothetical protein [Clostridiaceae bacterium]